MPVRKYGEPKVKNKVAMSREYGWASVTIANGGVNSSTIDIGLADSIMLVLPSSVNAMTIKIQTQYDDAGPWIDLVSWTAATGIKVFTDATELARIRHGQMIRFNVSSAVGSESVIWISIKG